MPKDNLIPEEPPCSISGQIRIDLVIAAEGHTDQREAIGEGKWLQTHDTSSVHSNVSQLSTQRPSPLTFLYSNLASILPDPMIVLIQEYYVASEEVAEFLKFVAEGDQDKAEAMLKKNPALALAPTDVTDLSKRTFKNITALQYALWSLDWHMWTMLLKYMPPEVITDQIAQSERGLWVPQHGVAANWDKLIQALNQYVSEVRANKPLAVYKQTWIKQVGGAQLLLPAHVINEYCHPTRHFDLVPDFSKPEAAGVWRTRQTSDGEWFSAKVGGGMLGEGFAVCRGSNGRVVCVPLLHRLVGAERDSTAVSALFKTRASQRAALVAQYLPKPETARRFAPGLSAGSSSQ